MIIRIDQHIERMKAVVLVYLEMKCLSGLLMNVELTLNR